MSYYCSVQRAVSHDYFLHTLFFMGKRSLVGPENHPSIFSRESAIFSMEKKLLQFLTKGHENNPRNDIPHRIISWKQIIQKMTIKSKYVGSNNQRCKETELYTKKLLLI
jgi:hypothetical protein